MVNFSEIFKNIKFKSPLIYNITNLVVTNISANALLSLGASPIMSFSEKEASELVEISNALVLNMGTPTDAVLKTMLVAGRRANELNIPIVFDPVGVGASLYRFEFASKILSELKISILRGNYSEIARLYGSKIQMKGVDSINDVENITYITKNLSHKLNCIVCASGKTDIISDGNKIYGCNNGDVLLTKITGSGCILSAICGATCAVCNDLLDATLCACVIVGLSGQMAAQKTLQLGSFQVEFFNELSAFSNESFDKADYKLL